MIPGFQGHAFHTCMKRMTLDLKCGEIINVFFEQIPALFVVVELAPAGAGRGKEDGLSGFCFGNADFHSFFQIVNKKYPFCRESQAHSCFGNFFTGLPQQDKVSDFSVKSLNPFFVGGIFIKSPPISKVGRFIAWIPLIAASGLVPLESL